MTCQARLFFFWNIFLTLQTILQILRPAFTLTFSLFCLKLSLTYFQFFWQNISLTFTVGAVFREQSSLILLFLSSQMPRTDRTGELVKHCCKDVTDLILAEDSNSGPWERGKQKSHNSRNYFLSSIKFWYSSLHWTLLFS